MNKCAHCKKDFQIDAQDQEYYKKIGIPEPKICSDCRLQQRMAFRNERNLYKRVCDLSAKNIVTIYSPDKKLKVYSQEAWWSDKWDPLSFGRPFDFKRPFFEQYGELIRDVPHPAVGYSFNCENCEFTTYQNDSRNCYLTTGSGYMEDCAYTNWTNYAKNSQDILGSENLELCYELVDCNKMYSSKNCQDCSSLTDCQYCYDCQSCENCFGCVGLRRKKFCFLNEQLTEQEYKERIKNVDVPSFLAAFEALKSEKPHRRTFELNCENCSGDHLINCKNVTDSFFTTQSQDCRYHVDVVNDKDCYDCNRCGDSQLSYGCQGGGQYYDGKFCFAGELLTECWYCISCFQSKNLFGCIGVKRGQYCILNKQYTKEEYEELLPRIFEHMRAGGELGEFLPMTISPFAYNETLAHEFYPLTQEEVAREGLQWKEKDKQDYLPQTYHGSYSVQSLTDGILKEVLACQAQNPDGTRCGRNYKITVQELKFYQKMGIDLPRKCPDCRHKDRIALRNPRKLWERACVKCSALMKTTFPPESKVQVYCDACYLQEIY